MAQVELPATGQVSCWDSAGAVVPCAGTGDDGEIQAGVAWPAPRFTDLGDCILDELTGLTWAKDAGVLGDMPTWAASHAWANDLELCGETDWRVPNVVEMRSLYHAEEASAPYLQAQGFTDVANAYWSSTTDPASPSRAWSVALAGGGVNTLPKDNDTVAHGAWPVRGQTAPPAATWQTGQQTCFDVDGLVVECTDTGQDGDHRAGEPWPEPRFTVNGDGTVTDELTGLVWSEDTQAPGPPACNPDTWKSWNLAHDYIACLNDRAWLGFVDWGLPNLTQLSSLVDWEGSAPALPPGHPFLNVEFDATHWSSTTAQYLGDWSWDVDMNDGAVGTAFKGQTHAVWPLRTLAVPEPGQVPLLLAGLAALAPAAWSRRRRSLRSP